MFGKPKKDKEEPAKRKRICPFLKEQCTKACALYIDDITADDNSDKGMCSIYRIARNN